MKAGQRDELIVGKLEYAFETRDHENALRRRRNAAENKPMTAVAQELTQLEKLRQHGRLYEIEDYENERRAGYGLPPIREEAAEVRAILDATGAGERG